MIRTPPTAPGRPAVDSGGPNQAWRQARRCAACKTGIIAGPYETCAQGHTVELAPNDIVRTLDARQRRLLERGYWNRWLLGLVAVVLLLVQIGAWLLVPTGLVRPELVEIIVALAGIVSLAAIWVSPPVLAYPSVDQLQRQARAAEPPGE